MTVILPLNYPPTKWLFSLALRRWFYNAAASFTIATLAGDGRIGRAARTRKEFLDVVRQGVAPTPASRCTP